MIKHNLSVGFCDFCGSSSELVGIPAKCGLRIVDRNIEIGTGTGSKLYQIEPFICLDCIKKYYETQ